MKRTLPYTIALLGLLGVACEQVVEIAAPESDAQLVVEGWVYDDRDTQTVTLHRSAPYFAPASFPAEPGARVVITTQAEDTLTLVEAEAGVYQASFRGQVDQQYTLMVETRDGQRYVSAPQRLRPVAPLDSVYAVYRDTAEVIQAGYYPAWNYTDPEGRADYYRWKFYVNDTLRSRAADILVLSDAFLDGETITEAEFVDTTPLSLNDTLTIEQLSISREALNFFRQVQRLARNGEELLGTSSDPVPTNMMNTTHEQHYALGFFGASSVARASAVVSK